MDLEKKVNKNEKRIETVEQAIQLLSQLTISHTDEIERMLFGIDETKGSIIELRNSIKELRESQKDTQEKLNALIDAQIRGEDSMQELKNEMKDLAKVVKLAHQRIDKIEQK
ncbi:MAG: hypothetical protein ACR2MD_01990 [Aridibacter sp.]|jgi:chromosome segregation ATPase|nr:hypothetical protein [Acidobacteriota bacterium]